MISGQGSSQSSRSSTNVWGPQQEYLKNLYGRAEDLSKQDPYQYGPDRTVGFDPASQRAFSMAEQRGSGLTDAASEELQRTMGGEYLSPESNPWLQRYSDVGARNISRNYYNTVNQLGSRMEAAGRTGSGAHAYGSQIAGENLATGLGDYEAQLWGGAYNAERGRMGQAVGQAPAVNEAGWRNISGVRAVGAQREELSQRRLDDLVARFQQQQYGPAQKLAEFSSMIGQPIMTSKSKSKGSSFGFGIMS